MDDPHWPSPAAGRCVCLRSVRVNAEVLQLFPISCVMNFAQTFACYWFFHVADRRTSSSQEPIGRQSTSVLRPASCALRVCRGYRDGRSGELLKARRAPLLQGTIQDLVPNPTPSWHSSLVFSNAFAVDFTKNFKPMAKAFQLACVLWPYSGIFPRQPFTI